MMSWDSEIRNPVRPNHLAGFFSDRYWANLMKFPETLILLKDTVDFW